MKKLISIALTTLMLAACQTVYMPKAREVKKKPKSSGIIALPTNYRPEDRSKADELMKANCGSLAVNVTDEGEMTVGHETKSNASTTDRDDTRTSAGTLFGIPVVSGANAGTNSETSSVTKELKEWQVVYNCDTPEKPAKAKK